MTLDVKDIPLCPGIKKQNITKQVVMKKVFSLSLNHVVAFIKYWRRLKSKREDQNKG